MSDNLPNNRGVEQDSESSGKVRKSRSKLMLILLAAAIGLSVSDGCGNNSSADKQETPRLHFDFMGEINKALKESADEEAKKKDKKVKEEKSGKPDTDSKMKKSKKKPAKEEGNPKDDDLPPQTALA